MKKELWLRLKHYHFEHVVSPQLLDHVTAAFGRTDASTKAFAGKLTRKLGWTTPFSVRAIAEYKRFLYLGMVSDFPVTPSRVIDQVWHEHLLFSRAYREFCRDVLGREFDHNPELLASDDQTGIFQSQYEATLDLYETEFHMEPPAEIWSTPKFKDRRSVKPRKAQSSGDTSSASTRSDDAPLYMYFDGSGGDGGQSHGDMSEFGGGGGFSGGGGGTSWGDHSTSDSTSDAGGDSGGGGSDGGSSCSSGCGGGGE